MLDHVNGEGVLGNRIDGRKERDRERGPSQRERHELQAPDAVADTRLAPQTQDAARVKHRAGQQQTQKPDFELRRTHRSERMMGFSPRGTGQSQNESDHDSDVLTHSSNPRPFYITMSCT